MNEKGSVLIVSMWILMIFLILLVSLGFHASQEVLLMKREKENVQAKLDFVSSLTKVFELLSTDPDPHRDSPEDAWYGTLTLKQPWAKRVSIEVKDEESKINLNTAGETLLREFFKKISQETALKEEEEAFTKAILKQRAKNRIASFEELYLMEDIDPKNLEKLRPYFTVYPEAPQMNLNTASPLILNALIQSLPGDDFAKEELEKKILEYRGDKDGRISKSFSSESLSPNALMQLLSLDNRTQMVQLVNALLPNVTTDSQTFEIHLKHASGKKAEAVMSFKNSSLVPEILSWHEN